MFHLNFYLWFMDLWFTLWYGLYNWLSVKYQDTVKCNSLSASTAVVNPAAGKYHCTGKWEDVFFPSPFQNHKAFVRMAASLPCTIHFSVVHFLWGDGWGWGLNLRVLVYEQLLYSCSLSNGIQNGGREGAAWVLKCVVFGWGLFKNQRFLFLFQQVACSLRSVLRDFVHSAL